MPSVRARSSSPRSPTDGPTSRPAISFDPRPPQAGEAPTEIVAGFLEAMKATPIRTHGRAPVPLARRPPTRGCPSSRSSPTTSSATPRARSTVRIPLADVNLYDARGAWEGTQARQRARPRPGPGGRRVAHRRGAGRTDRPGLVVRRLVPAGLPLLLRPHLRGARPRAGLRAPGRPVRLLAGPRPARTASPTRPRTSYAPTSPPAPRSGCSRSSPGSPRSRSPATPTRSTRTTAQRMLAQLVVDAAPGRGHQGGRADRR